MQLTNWGGYPSHSCNLLAPANMAELKPLLELDQTIARGMGRSYGDASLAANTISTLKLNQIQNFDEKKGIVTCQTGVTLKDIITTCLPRGWFLPVTPGTQFITVGGAIAADVHGKNHHIDGSFCDFLVSFKILTTNKKEILCSPQKNADLFHATCGGMGLTGLITSASIRLRRIETAYIKQTTIAARNLKEVFELFEANAQTAYSVAWIDCLARKKHLGRSILLLGEHAKASDLPREKNPFRVKEKKPLNIHSHLPSYSLNKFSMRLFNWLYYIYHSRRRGQSIVDYQQFFYPLDAILNWNRVYGKRGFIQYQLLLPKTTALKGMNEILHDISHSGFGSFLAVLKLLGQSNKNLLSFASEGYTLGLDFAIQPDLFAYLDHLDQLVLKHGGRIYLAKDARMRSAMFQQTYASLKKFLQIKKKYDKRGLLNSYLWQRLRP